MPAAAPGQSGTAGPEERCTRRGQLRAGMVLCAVALLASACSSRQAYEGLQAGQRSQCIKLPEPDRSQCIESTGLSHEDYERQRGK